MVPNLDKKYIFKVFFIIFFIYFSEYFLYIFHHQQNFENIFLGYFLYITFRLGGPYGLGSGHALGPWKLSEFSMLFRAI